MAAAELNSIGEVCGFIRLGNVPRRDGCAYLNATLTVALNYGSPQQSDPDTLRSVHACAAIIVPQGSLWVPPAGSLLQRRRRFFFFYYFLSVTYPQ